MRFPFEAGSEPRVVAADDSLVAVYKPPRLHSAPLPGGGPSLAAWVFERFPDAALRDGALAQGVAPEGGALAVRVAREGGLIHRLDYETSGLVLFARNEAAFAGFLAEQEAGRIEKEYLLCARPAPHAEGLCGSRPPCGTPLGLEPEVWQQALAEARGAFDRGREESVFATLSGLASLLASLAAACPLVECYFRPFGPGGARVACVAEGVENAKRRGAPQRRYATYLLEAEGLRYNVGNNLREDLKAALALRVRLFRGFRHQIRAQLSWIGLPLVGDTLYGGAAAPRLMLHASRVSFWHPVTGTMTNITCEGNVAFSPPLR